MKAGHLKKLLIAVPDDYEVDVTGAVTGSYSNFNVYITLKEALREVVISKSPIVFRDRKMSEEADVEKELEDLSFEDMKKFMNPIDYSS